jgi:pimeloyl-ACP methyl ester carboxylesterase
LSPEDSARPSQRTFLAVFLIALAPRAWAESANPPITGDWDGALTVPGGIKLPLILHFAPAGATLDSPDQNAAGVAVTVSRDGDAVTINLPASNARFSGVLSGDGQDLSGPFTQGGVTMSARFTRRAPGAAAPVRDRPQTPKPPFPYAVREVRFAGGPGVVLAGTLSQPNGPGPFPAVVMIAGSGPQNRDETIEGHKVFAVIADRLTRAGIAVLRYDKRGVGASGGRYASATGADFADDAQAAADWLAGQPGIAPAKIGLIGHSEGAEIAPIVADRDPRIAYVVLLCAPAVSGAQTIASQQKAILLAAGVPAAEVEAKNALERRVLEAVRTAPDAPSAEAAAQALLTQAGVAPAAARARAQLASAPWYREFLNDDPAPALRKLRQPTLVIAGSKDLQVLPDLNLPVIRAALAGNKAAKVVELDGLNHLLQPAATGAPSEYGTIPITVAPAALDMITDWVAGQTK